mmetsp:Transcript_93833/g.148219  ORF Transcript_93833/g.148219 Transcript_93833/m.148219 type:complete len:85 (-) Transcript_93833:33-287(-)
MGQVRNRGILGDEALVWKAALEALKTKSYTRVLGAISILTEDAVAETFVPCGQRRMTSVTKEIFTFVFSVQLIRLAQHSQLSHL